MPIPLAYSRPLEREPLAQSVSDELVRLAIESIKDYAIFLLDVEGRITSWNLGAERTTGWREEEVMGQPLSFFFDSEDVAEGQMELELSTAAIGGHYEGNGWRLHKSGLRFWAEVSVRVLRGEGGQTLGYVKVMRDMTERRQADEERQRVEAELRRRAEFEQHLIGIVSHDLRTPLSAILVGAATLRREPGLGERALRVVERIESSAWRATRMTRDLLDFTQARLGRGIAVYPAPLDAHELVRQVLEEVRVGDSRRQVQVEVHGDGRGEWDPDRLAQVLTNLVTNALRYSPEDTPVTVRAAGEDEAVLLEVHNQGDPLPAEQQARLFEPMRRGEKQRGGAHRSVGLGLYIVRHLVEAHGGTIRVHSESQAGTTFSVRLPRRRAALSR